MLVHQRVSVHVKYPNLLVVHSFTVARQLGTSKTDLLVDHYFNHISPIYKLLVGGFNLKKMKVNWDDDIPNIWKVIKAMFQTTNQIAIKPVFVGPHVSPLSGPHDEILGTVHRVTDAVDRFADLFICLLKRAWQGKTCCFAMFLMGKYGWKFCFILTSVEHLLNLVVGKHILVRNSSIKWLEMDSMWDRILHDPLTWTNLKILAICQIRRPFGTGPFWAFTVHVWQRRSNNMIW